jgi:hypothetical protein
MQFGRIRIDQTKGGIARTDFAAIRRHYGPMRRSLWICLSCLSLAGCASNPNSGVNAAVGARLADMPHWMGGLPSDAPPRPGTPEYDAWMAERAKEAARPKSSDPKQGAPH